MEHVELSEFDWLEEIADRERWEASDRKTWSRIAKQFDDWFVDLDERPPRVTATRGETSISEHVRRGESDMPVLDALVRLSTRLAK